MVSPDIVGGGIIPSSGERENLQHRPNNIMHERRKSISIPKIIQMDTLSGELRNGTRPHHSAFVERAPLKLMRRTAPSGGKSFAFASYFVVDFHHRLTFFVEATKKFVGRMIYRRYWK